MWLKNVVKSLTATSTRRSTRRTLRAARPCFELLEDRWVPSFSMPVDYGASLSRRAVVTADFNGDGRLDLATANHDDHTVGVLLGNGDGTFQAPRTSATGSYPAAVASGDLNADGKLDLVTANRGEEICVLLGNGNGTFQAPSRVFLASNPQSVAVGDFNADGKLDLGVLSNWPLEVSISYANVLLGTGSGTFSAPIRSFLGQGLHYAVAMADFNDDSKLDFAASSEYGAVDVALGNGMGSFSYPTKFGATGLDRGGSLVAADLNNDGRVDLATSHLSLSESSGWISFVSVLLGTGTGWFTSGGGANTDSQSGSLASADFNGDGNADLVIASTTGTVGVLLGTGAGSFRPPVTSVVNAAPFGVAVGDFNGDGRPDAATANPNTVSVLLNDGAWTGLGATTLAINDVTVTEGNMGTADATFTVSLSAATDQPVTVRYATADGTATAGSDYDPVSGTLTFTPGEMVKTVTAVVIGDHQAEYNESFRLVLTDPTNAFLADSSGGGNIVDDEPYVAIDYGPVYVTEGNNRTTAVVFTVRLSTASDVPVTVDFATADLSPDEEYWHGLIGGTAGVDYVASSGTVTFEPGGPTTKDVTVLVTGDRVGESHESFFVNLSNPTNAGLSSTLSVGTIVDDEPYVSISGGGAVVEGNSGTKTITFSVTLSAASDAPVTVTYTTADNTATAAGGDYQARNDTLTFNPGGPLTQSFTVVVNGDRLGESAEYFYVNLTDVTGALVSNSTAYATIVDDEPRVSISDVTKGEGKKGQTTLFTFTVTLSAAYDQPVTMSFRTANGTAATSDGDYVAKAGTLTFAPGETTKTITIEVKGDSKREANEDFYLDLFGNSGNSLCTKNRGLGTILNDD